MSINLGGASEQRVRNTSPVITGYPFTAGLWVNPDGVAALDSIFSLFTGDEGFLLLNDNGNLRFYTFDSGGNSLAQVGSFFNVGEWAYVVMRAISSTNRWVSGISRGAPSHAQSTVARAPGTATVMTFGSWEATAPSSYFDGRFDGAFYTNTDIQPDGAELSNSLLRQLAYQGPLSVPHIAASIRNKGEYRSFRSRITQIDHAEVMWGAHAPPLWTNVNGVTIGPENPHSAAWVQPHDDDGLIPVVIPPEVAGGSAATTGTASSGTTEANIVAGGRTIILTLTGDTWVAAGATFDAQRQAIINGLDSAQLEATGWDAVVKAGLAVGDVVRTSDTVVTITLPAFSTYNITAAETITPTIPAAALVGAAAIVSTTFSVATVPFITVSGTMVPEALAADIVAGGKTIILTLNGDEWLAAGAAFDAQRQNIINGLDSNKAEAAGWDAVVKAGLGVGQVVRTSATIVTITLSAFGTFVITESETITATIPATAVVSNQAIVGSPTFIAAVGSSGARRPGRRHWRR